MNDFPSPQVRSLIYSPPVLFLFIFILISCLHASAGDKTGLWDKITVPSALKSATVYRNGAELTHTATATLHQGNNELIIGDISNNIDVNSIQVGCTGSVTIMSVEFSKEFLKEGAESPLMRKLQDSLGVNQKEQERIAILVKSDNDLLDLLKANKEIRGTNTGLSVSELMKMMDYYKQKSLELQNELSAYKEKEDKLKKLAARLESQILEEDKLNTVTSGRILLQVLSPTAGSFGFTVSYLTPTAFWNPSYDLRVDNISNPLKLVYKAKLVQTSGIDWKQVKLTLSTSVPNQQGNAPVLKTWFLSFIDPVAAMDGLLKGNTLQSLAGRVAGVSVKTKELNDVVVIGYGTQKIRGSASDADSDEPLYVVDGRPMTAEEFGKIDIRAIKKTEVLKDEKARVQYGSRGSNGVVVVTLKDELGDYVSVRDNEMNVVFDIDIPYDIPTNGKEQNVVLKEYTAPSTYKYYSAPRLDKDAYLLGELPDWTKLNLLPGEANIIFEGTYIGKSYIDPSSTQDTLNLTLGRDKRVVVRREKLVDYSSVKFMGSNKKQILTYEITVKNNKKEKLQMLLKDQYPISSTKDIEEELLESSGAEINRETGVLTWKLQLAPGESKKFRVSYSVKYPKDKTVNIN